METVESLMQELSVLVMANHRGRLHTRGLARGMIWRDGELPPGSPAFSSVLSTDLLDHGFRILDFALAIRELGQDTTPELARALRIAGESIESAVRRGEPKDPGRGFHLCCAAAAFHIGHYSSRAVCLLRGDLDALNLASPEKMLVLLMRRELSRLDGECAAWFTQPEHTDAGLTNLLSTDSELDVDDVLFVALAKGFCEAIAAFVFGLSHGLVATVRNSLDRLNLGIQAAAKVGHVPMWWLFRIAKHLLDDLWQQSYHVRLPRVPVSDVSSWNELRRNFIEMLAGRDLAQVDLWPSQIIAAGRAINQADDLVVALPTSAGKTRIAELCILRCLASGRRAVYVTPLRALSAQVENTLADTFRPLGFSTTSVYGAAGIGVVDVETLGSGNIVVATPEKLDFAIRQDPDVIEDVGLIVLDEGHMIGLGEREIRYETLVQRLLRRDDADNRRIVCLSAVFSKGPSFDAFNEWIRSGDPGHAIRSIWRPTRQRSGELVWDGANGRLDYSVDDENVFIPRFVEGREAIGRRTNDFPANKNEFIVAATQRFTRDGRAVLIYSPIRKSVETLAEAFLKAHRQGYLNSFVATAEAPRLADARRVGIEWLGADHAAVKALDIGIAVHHGQLPRPFLREIERLLKDRVLKVAISSPTLAQGVDLSFEVLIFSSLWRNREIIPAPEFANAIGRVGRAHVDLDGIYVIPVFEDSDWEKKKRLSEFRNLDQLAKKRSMESGILELLERYLSYLAQKLGVARSQVAEYVLNNASVWAGIGNDGDGQSDADQWAVIATNELDNGIFATVGDLDCTAKEVADRLDNAMRDSFWLKRLSLKNEFEQAGQWAVLKSRAKWLWRSSTPAKRQGYFAAGIGYAAGEVISGKATEFAEHLRAGEAAVLRSDPAKAAKSAIGLGGELLKVYPFTCDLPENWEAILHAWLAGQPTSELADNSETAFVQEGIVYRLVWAVEAVRITLVSSNLLTEVGAAGNLGLCLTFGAPNIPAALLLQCGLASRTLAVHLVQKLALSFTDNKGLKAWCSDVAAGKVNPNLSGEHEAEWARFVKRLRHDRSQKWKRTEGIWSANWATKAPPDGTMVRVHAIGEITEVQTPEMEFLGTIKRKPPSGGGLNLGVVVGAKVKVIRYGPGEGV